MRRGTVPRWAARLATATPRRAAVAPRPATAPASAASAATSLGPTEARGYIRARAINIIREETNRLIEQEGTALVGQRAKIEDAALDLLIHQLSVQLAHPRSHTHRRRAA